MEELKQLTEEIVEYTRTWSLTETAWYWAIDCVRKPDNIKDKILLGKSLKQQSEKKYCMT